MTGRAGVRFGAMPAQRVRRWVGLAVLVASPAAAQQAVFEPRPLTPLGLEVLEDRFDEIQAVAERDLEVGVVAATPGQRAVLDSLAGGIRETIDAMASKRARPGDARRLKALLQQHNAFLRGLYRPGALPPEINRPWNAISLSFLAVLAGDLAEYDRRFFIRYGPGSEPLNILEVVLVQVLTPAPRGPGVRYPSPWEPIARVQLFGYQYYAQGSRLAPASPVYQLGATRYFFGDGALSRVLHHVGLAAAFQRDFVRDANLAGGVLHVAGWDLGAFCAVDDCRRPVFMASRSLSVFGGIWARARDVVAGL